MVLNWRCLERVWRRMEWVSRVWEEGLCLRTQVESFRDETWSFWRARRRCLRRKVVREVDKVWSFSQWDS